VKHIICQPPKPIGGKIDSVLKVLTNETRGGVTVVSFDRSRAVLAEIF
jgi:hypothetical protein